ncbi:hypothetical protein ACFE04_015145 [Oxalis oulophora]
MKIQGHQAMLAHHVSIPHDNVHESTAATTSLASFNVQQQQQQRRRPGFAYTRHTKTCTPQYWSSRTEAWPRMVPQLSTVSNVFGSRVSERFRSDMTLLESTAYDDNDDDVYNELMKEGIAALLNSYARKGFPYTAWEVKTLLIQALVSQKAATLQAQQFFLANQACN